MLRLIVFWSLLAAVLSTWLYLAFASFWALSLAGAILLIGALGFFLAERGLVRVLGAAPALDPLLNRAYLKACLGLSARKLPSLWILPAPLVLAFGVRSVGSQGRVLVSVGALELLSDHELSEVLRAAVQSARARGTPTRTWATLLRHALTIEGDPSPLGFAFRIGLAPWMRTLVRASRGGKSRSKPSPRRVFEREQSVAGFLGGADLGRFEGVRVD